MAETPIRSGDDEDLRAMVAHAHAVAATVTVESAQSAFGQHGVDFIAVLEGERLVGVCARRELTAVLGSRYGFALNARRAVTEQMLAGPLCIRVATPMTEVFKATAVRSDRAFHDDVVLVDADNHFLGMIPVRTIMRRQTEHLLGNIARVEASRREIAE